MKNQKIRLYYLLSILSNDDGCLFIQLVQTFLIVLKNLFILSQNSTRIH